ncbi:MAG TPA: methyltransferase domain-containing protein [Anaerolineales bacterium]
MPWNPDRYQQFEKERSAPFEDLFGLVKIRSGLDVVDLGCGTGRLTRLLADRLPGSRVLGIDASPEMLGRTAEVIRPGLVFELDRIEQVAGSWDLVFSNAAIQWVDDHLSLLPRLLSLVRPGGQLVVQLPSNYSHPAHTSILEVAAEPPFRQALGGWTHQSSVLSIEAYAELLYRHGAVEMTVLEKVYPHVLADAAAVADWSSGTALVPYFERLAPDLREKFMQRYRQRLLQVWPVGPVFFGFRRILFSASMA